MASPWKGTDPVDTRTHRRRGSLAAALLSGAMLIAAAVPAFAGDTRNVFVGSPGAADGTLVFTEVSAGQQTKTDVFIENGSPSTMNKTTLSIGAFPAAAPLPAGVTIDGKFGANAGQCSIAADKLSATCDFGNLRSGQSKSVSFIFGIANAGTPDIDIAVKVKETVNDNGANADTFHASARLTVAGAGCDSVATFVAPGQAKHVTTANATNCTPQTTELDIPGLPAGATVKVSEITDTSCVASGKSCFGAKSVANVNNGATVSLVWSITWLNSTIGTPIQEQKLGVVHVEDDGDIVLIPNTNAGRCGNSPSKTNCIVSVTVGATTTTIVFKTPSNGYVKGWK